MRSTVLFVFAMIAIGLGILGYSFIEHSYSLGLEDKYGGGVAFGRWFYLGAIFACIPLAGFIVKRAKLKFLAAPLMLWVSMPTLFLIGAGIYDIWF